MAQKKTATKKRANGVGSVYHRKDGKWIAAISLPTLPGQPNRRKVKVGRNEAHAKRLLGEMRRELDKSGDLMTRVPTVKEWSDYWLKTVCADLKPKARYDYEGVMRRYVVPYMGTKKIDKVTPTMILNMYAWMQTPKDKDGLGLSSTTALGAHRKVKKMFRDAKALAGLAKNPAEDIPAPSAAIAKQKTLTTPQALTFLTTHAHRPYVSRYAAGFFTGARQGEILGLHIENVEIIRDADKNPVDVDVEFAWSLQRLTYEHGCKDGACGKKRGADCPERHFDIPGSHEAVQMSGGLHLLRPKTKGSWRVTSGGPMLAQVLDRAIGDRTEGLIWTMEDGTPIDPRTDWGIWQEWLVEAGLPKMGTHAQRHTASTLLAITGADEKTRMDMLGHTTTQINRRYTHDDMSLQRAASARLGSTLEFDYSADGAALDVRPTRVLSKKEQKRAKQLETGSKRADTLE